MKLTFAQNSKEKFEWDTDDLNVYIDENVDDLETRIVEQARTSRFMRVVEGLKGTQKLNDLTTDFEWQDGDRCGGTPSGGASFGRKEITVGDIMIYMSFCNKDLVDFWPRTKLKPGAGAELETLPFEQIIMDDIMKKNALLVDTAIWKSDV